MSGNLLTITSQAENDAVRGFFLKGGWPAGNRGGKWIGGYQLPTQSESNAGWQWVTGEPWSFTDWHQDEPSDGAFGSEQALFFHTDGGGGAWYDASEFSTGYSGYLTEYTPTTVVPEPASMVLFGLGGLTLSFFRRRKA
jgi:hypothetical protein